jgi:hypothetical protein
MGQVRMQKSTGIPPLKCLIQRASPVENLCYAAHPYLSKPATRHGGNLYKK